MGRFQLNIISKATESQLSQNFSAFQKFMKRPQTKFHTDTMSNSKLLSQKSQNFLAAKFFSIAILFKLQQDLLMFLQV